MATRRRRSRAAATSSAPASSPARREDGCDRQPDVPRIADRRAGLRLVLALAVVVTVGGCGGDVGGQATTATQPQSRARASAAELRWQRQIEGFVAGLLPELRRLQELTGGGANTGAAGFRLDPRVFVPGPKRRQFVATMAELSRCGPAFKAAVPPPPTPRLRPIRATFAHACHVLEAVPFLLRSEVLRASGAADVDRDSLAAAVARAREGVRLVVDGLATLRRLLARP